MFRQLSCNVPWRRVLTAHYFLQDITLAQQTPVRVAKRRADLVRTRTVHTLRCDMVPVSRRLLAACSMLTSSKWADSDCRDWMHMVVASLQGTDNHCILDLRTQAGTYVKVLVGMCT